MTPSINRMRAILFALFGVLFVGCLVLVHSQWNNIKFGETLNPRKPETLLGPTKQHTTVNTIPTDANLSQKRCRKLPDDITLFKSEKEPSMCCKRCAIVSSSGVMMQHNDSREIDSSDCVIRMNNAPTLEYEKYVGAKTTIRVFSHTSVLDVKNMLMTHKVERNNTIFIAWGPERNMLPGRITNIYLQEIARYFSGIQLYVFSEKRVQAADDIFEIETGKNRMKSGSFLTTGWFTILLAKDICQEIHVYGMVEDDHCKKLITKHLPDTPYHYYKKGESQCAMYNFHEYARSGAHRYLTEKKVYKKWAKEWGNMDFHNPEWDLN